MIEPACHLSAALATGFAFRRAWRICVEDQHGQPCTSAADRTHPELEVIPESEAVRSGSLAVDVNLLPREVESSVEATIRAGEPPRRRLTIRRRELSRDLIPADIGPMAAMAADAIKNARAGCDRVDLFLAGPATFAVLLGSELNAVGCPIRLHEHDRNRYVPILDLEAQ